MVELVSKFSTTLPYDLDDAEGDIDRNISFYFLTLPLMSTLYWARGSPFTVHIAHLHVLTIIQCTRIHVHFKISS